MLNKLKCFTYIRNTGGKKSMSVNVIETDAINITIEAICIPEWWHFKATFSCHSLHFQKVSAVYRCMTYRWTVVAFCLAEGEKWHRDCWLVDTWLEWKAKRWFWHCVSQLSTYRTQRGFKAITFLTSKVTKKSFCTQALSFESYSPSPFHSTFTAYTPYTLESVHPNTTQQKLTMTTTRKHTLRA